MPNRNDELIEVIDILLATLMRLSCYTETLFSILIPGYSWGQSPLPIKSSGGDRQLDTESYDYPDWI